MYLQYNNNMIIKLNKNLKRLLVLAIIDDSCLNQPLGWQLSNGDFSIYIIPFTFISLCCTIRTFLFLIILLNFQYGLMGGLTYYWIGCKALLLLLLLLFWFSNFPIDGQQKPFQTFSCVLLTYLYHSDFPTQ
jgi:hypothetical protein